MIRIADYVMKRLCEEGINHIFYVPGGQCVYLTDAVRRCENLEGISVHHEQAAAMAAVSYSNYSENICASVGDHFIIVLSGTSAGWYDQSVLYE